MSDLFQETYPQSAPIWFSEDEEQSVSAAIVVVSEVQAEKYNVSSHCRSK